MDPVTEGWALINKHRPTERGAQIVCSDCGDVLGVVSITGVDVPKLGIVSEVCTKVTFTDSMNRACFTSAGER